MPARRRRPPRLRQRRRRPPPPSHRRRRCLRRRLLLLRLELGLLLQHRQEKAPSYSLLEEEKGSVRTRKKAVRPHLHQLQLLHLLGLVGLLRLVLRLLRLVLRLLRLVLRLLRKDRPGPAQPSHSRHTARWTVSAAHGGRHGGVRRHAGSCAACCDCKCYSWRWNGHGVVTQRRGR